MSVIGIDFGSINCTIAATQKGGVDILTDEVSSRQTPSMVGFTEKERCIGQSALTQYTRNLKNTVSNIKLLLGRRWSDAEVQEELKQLPFKAVEMPGDNIGIQVMYANEQKVFSVVAIAGMILYKLRQIAAAGVAKEVRDVVVSVPGFWSDQQRRALLDAARVAGLNPLRLVNDVTATALSYGLFKRDVPEADKEPLMTLFVDVGLVQTSAAVVAFSQGKLRVVSAAYDRRLGGRDFDRLLVEHFAAEFRTKYKLDVLANPRALQRLEAACERVKKTLNINPDVPLSIDSLLNDTDVKSTINRSQFEELASSLLNRVLVPIEQALSQAGITADKLGSVEVTGGSTRMVSFQNRLNEWLKAHGGKELSKGLNAEESVARGAALQCAVLSPLFKLQREYIIQDITAYPIHVAWPDGAQMETDGAGASVEQLELPRASVFPLAKKLTMFRRSPINVTASYGESELLAASQKGQIGSWLVDVQPAAGSNEAQKVSLTVRIDLHGVVSVDSAQLSVPVEEAAAEGAAPAAAVASPTTPAAADSTATPPAADGTAAPATDGDEKKAAATKKKVRHHTLPVVEHTATLATTALDSLREEEAQMQASDRLARETADTKNLVESSIYEVRSRVSEGGAWVALAVAADREALLALLERTENWLYEDGADQTKSVYAAKLAELQALSEPIKKRHWEQEHRWEAVTQLRAAIQRLGDDAKSTEAKYDHIEAAERTKVSDMVAQAEQWLNKQLQQQEHTAKTVAPVITVAEINKRKTDLTQAAEAILNKPKPRPPPAPTPAAAPADAKPAADGAAADKEKADKPAPATADTASAAPDAAMDLD